MYMFIMLDIKNKQIIFLVFMKFKLNPCDFNKLVIKSMMHVKYKRYFLILLVC